MSEAMVDFLGDDGENFVLSQISEEDVDNLALSQFCGEMEDDMSLSQIAMKIEKDYKDDALCQGGDRNVENFTIPLQFESFVSKESFDDTNLVAESDFDIFQTAIFDLGLNFEEMQAPSNRFTTVVTDEEISNLVNEKMKANTKKNTKWAVGVFNQWRSFRAQNGDPIIELHMMNAECMNYWLERFVMETRKQNGDEYPPKSLYYIVCGLLRHCRDMNVHDKNFLDQKDGRFAHFRRVLDAKMKDSLSKGLGTKVRRADPLSDDDEEKLWANGVFGTTNSTSLQYTVFFYNCKLFGLRGRNEHRNLDHSQFETGQDATGRFIRFIGRNNKTFKGGLGDLRLDNKDIKHYARGNMFIGEPNGNVSNGTKKYWIIIIAAFITLGVFIANDSFRFTQIISNRISLPTRIFRVSNVQKIIPPSSPITSSIRKHFICPRFVGRVGNHLFQFASSYGIAKAKGMDVVINANCDLLKVFDIKVDIRKDTSMCSSPKVKIIKENHSAVFDNTLMEFNATSDVRLTQYLQSYLYFAKYENELRKQLIFKDEIRTKAIKLLDLKLEKFGVSRKDYTNNKTVKNMFFKNNFTEIVTLIGVHIRRGDWVKHPEVGYNVATKEYLQQSVNLYKSRFKNIFFVVASNGMTWAKLNMPKNINVVYLEGNSPWLDLDILTLCEHFIATVGTFSWWAAWLSGGNVTYFKWPAREGTRFRKVFSKDFKDYYYPNWVGL